MSMISWIKNLAGASWFPYVAIGFTVVVAAATGYGYMKGYASAESKMKDQINKALKIQMKENQRLSQQDLKTVEKTIHAEQEIEDAIDEIVIPEIDPKCTAAFTEWMQSFNDAVRSTNAHTESVD